MPAPLRSLLGAGLQLIPPQWLLGNRFRRHLRWLEQTQYWTSDRIENYQIRRLKDVITASYHRSRFYRAQFDGVGFEPGDFKYLSDLRLLPLIDKTVLRDNLEDMCIRSPQSRDVDYVSTGGSSGGPLHFYIGSNRSAVEYAYLASSWRRVGFEIGRTLAVFRGRLIKAHGDAMPHEYDPILRHHHYSTFHMTEANMARYLAHVADRGPCYMHVYPSAVAMLARFIERTKVAAPANVLGIIAESENIYPEERAMVERVFGSRYFSCYGHTEKLVLGSECEHSTDYHVWPTYGFCELVDADGQPITIPGQTGEIVGTGFMNDVVPFIRYRTGDYATLVGTRCASCDRNHLILRDIRGHRTHEMLVANDGALISWTAINLHDDTFRQVRELQFFQNTPGQAVLRVVPAGALSPDERRHILDGLHNRLGDRIVVTLEACDSIRRTQRGKAIYVDQKLDLSRFSISTNPNQSPVHAAIR